MFVVFRTDASTIIGAGHLSRCLALAGALHQRGARCLFLCRGEGLAGLAELITQAGHALHPLPEGPAAAPDELAHAAWLPHGQVQDAAICIAALAGEPRPDWLIVDHYAIDRRWEKILRHHADRLMVIDDLADRSHNCELLLDHNLRLPMSSGPYDQLVPAHCQCLLGPRHALLRPEFAVPVQRTTPDRLRLLVMFGGADQDDLTGRSIELIANLDLPLDLDVVTGPLYPHARTLTTRLAKLPAARWHRAPQNVAAIMADCHIALGSPGTSSWERCARQLPSITLAVADNQVAMAEALAQRGAHLYLGRADEVSDRSLASAIELLAGNAAIRQALAASAAGVTDGRGALRVSSRLCPPTVEIRLANVADGPLLHIWRNAPEVRLQSFDTKPIELEQHLAWFARSLADPARVILIGRHDDTDIGCIRFDLADQAARVSIFLAPGWHGRGLAAPFLLAAGRWLSAQHPEITCIQAEVLSANDASKNAFLSAGYRHDHHVFVKKEH